ncbi:MAG: hypothetical protein WCK17_04260 [Verrucomicrobiota bacterium]
MDQVTQMKVSKSKVASAPTVGLRLKRETKKRIQAELAKINKKDFGKKVRCDELIGTALSLLTERHIKELQDASMTNADRLEQKFREYVKANPGMSKDQFLGKLLSGVAGSQPQQTRSSGASE